MDEQPSQVTVPTFADSQKGSLAACRVLARDETQPSCHVTSAPELSRIAGGCNDRGGDQGANAGDRHQPSRTIVTGGNSLDILGQLGDPLLKPQQIFKEIG